MTEEVKDIVTSEKVQEHVDSVDKTPETKPIDNDTKEHAPEFTDIERKAMAKGWKPKTEFYGDEEDFTEAEDFLRNHTWVKEIKRLNAKLEEKGKAIDKLVEHTNKVEEVTYKRAVAELTKQFENAVTMGDTATAKAINEQMIDLKTKEVQPPVVNTLPEAVRDFQARNTWFQNNNDPMTAAMTAFAVKVDAQIAAQNPGIDQKEELRRVEEAVKREFPNFFQKQKLETRTAPAHTAVESAVSTSSKPSKSGLDSLPKEARDLADILKKTTKNFNVENYVKQYKFINGL